MTSITCADRLEPTGIASVDSGTSVGLRCDAAGHLAGGWHVPDDLTEADW